ncbi:MAG: pyrroline-5-carboxylate reductase [Planktomarina sp.]
MIPEEVAQRGLVLIGCGKMGSAMLQGWLNGGLDAAKVWVQDPFPSDWVNASGVHVNAALPENPAVVLIAVKPQMMADTLPDLKNMAGKDTVFVSVAAGILLKTYEAALGEGAAIIRAMPNTPAAIGQGVTAIVGNGQATPAHMDMAEGLLTAIGVVVRLDAEAQMDAVTAVSGSGPGYMFHVIEALAAAGEAQGLSPHMSLRLATATLAGSGALAMAADESPTQLRENVMSPNGTTVAGLEVLMKELPSLMARTVDAAAKRSKEMSNG